MTAAQRLVKAEKILAVAGGEMVRSCALQAMWARCNNRTVLDAIVGTKAAFGFNFVRDALHRDLHFTPPIQMTTATTCKARAMTIPSMAGSPPASRPQALKP